MPMILPNALESNIITHVNQLNMGVGIVSADPTCATCNSGCNMLVPMED